MRRDFCPAPLVLRVLLITVHQHRARCDWSLWTESESAPFSLPVHLKVGWCSLTDAEAPVWQLAMAATCPPLSLDLAELGPCWAHMPWLFVLPVRLAQLWVSAPREALLHPARVNPFSQAARAC